MTPAAVRIGFDEDEFGTVSVNETGDGFDFAGPKIDSLKDTVRHYAEILARQAKDDNALKGIKPPAILALMLENMQGRAWAVEADPEEEVEEPDTTGSDDGEGSEAVEIEDAPEPAEGEVENSDGAPVGYTFAADGTLVANVFCATGPGGGVDPSCAAGGTVEFAVKPPKKLYRGIVGDGSSGAGTFSLGKGLYSTPSKGFLKGFKYDKIIELSPGDAFPRNPLVLRTPSHFADWLLEKSGERRMSDFGKKYPDPGEFVRSMGYDGVVAGDEVVKYGPKKES